MRRDPATWYALLGGLFLLAQGSTTLTALCVPAFDRAFPALLSVTRMVPAHSALHLVTAGLALAAVAAGPPHPRRFALGFGAFYCLLALAGTLTGQTLGLGLQPFDHPFHLLLGVLGLGAAYASPRR